MFNVFIYTIYKEETKPHFADTRGVDSSSNHYPQACAKVFVAR